MHPQDIAQRARALRLSKAEIARASGLDETHAGQVLNGRLRNAGSVTVAKLQAALVAAELAQVRRLAGLHPQEAMHAATVALCPQVAPAASEVAP